MAGHSNSGLHNAQNMRSSTGGSVKLDCIKAFVEHQNRAQLDNISNEMQPLTIEDAELKMRGD